MRQLSEIIDKNKMLAIALVYSIFSIYPLIEVFQLGEYFIFSWGLGTVFLILVIGHAFDLLLATHIKQVDRLIDLQVENARLKQKHEKDS